MGNEVTLRKNGNGKFRKVMVTAAIEGDQVLLDGVKSKVDEVSSLITDNKFSNDDVQEVAKKVNKSMDDLRKLLPDGDDDWEPPVDGSPENIRRLLERDIELLTNCSEQIGLNVANRFTNSKFRGMLNNYIENLEESRKSALDLSTVDNRSNK